MDKFRLLVACPFLLTGIGLVLLGRVILSRDDRNGFDRVYFSGSLTGTAPGSDSQPDSGEA